MKILYFGRDAWRDTNFDVKAAKHWFGLMSEGDSEVSAVLEKIARGEYPRISDDIDDFVKFFAGSKHAISSLKVAEFLEEIDVLVLHKINFRCHETEIIQMLIRNMRLKANQILFDRISLACIEKGLAVPSK